MKEIRKEYTEENQSEQKNIYKNKIIEVVAKIENPGILEYLYTFIKLFLEKWG